MWPRRCCLSLGPYFSSGFASSLSHRQGPPSCCSCCGCHSHFGCCYCTSQAPVVVVGPIPIPLCVVCLKIIVSRKEKRGKKDTWVSRHIHVSSPCCRHNYLPYVLSIINKGEEKDTWASWHIYILSPCRCCCHCRCWVCSGCHRHVVDKWWLVLLMRDVYLLEKGIIMWCQTHSGRAHLRNINAAGTCISYTKTHDIPRHNALCFQ